MCFFFRLCALVRLLFGGSSSSSSSFLVPFSLGNVGEFATASLDIELLRELSRQGRCECEDCKLGVLQGESEPVREAVSDGRLSASCLGSSAAMPGDNSLVLLGCLFPGRFCPLHEHVDGVFANEPGSSDRRRSVGGEPAGARRSRLAHDVGQHLARALYVGGLDGREGSRKSTRVGREAVALETQPCVVAAARG